MCAVKQNNSVSTKSMLNLMLHITLASALSVSLFMLAPMNFEQECVVYTSFDESNGIVNTLPDGTTQEAKANLCKEPVMDGTLSNVIQHAPWFFWLGLAALAFFSIYTIFIIGAPIMLYMMGYYEK